MIILEKMSRYVIAIHDDMPFIFMKDNFIEMDEGTTDSSIGCYVDKNNETQDVWLKSIYASLFFKALME